MTRLRTSRPKRSVPSGCSQLPRSIHTGGMSFALMSPAVGLCGARYAAKMAVTTRAARMTPANQGRSRLRASMADFRIQVAVEQVHEEIPDEIEGAQNEDARLHDGVVAGGDALEDQPSQARPGEHGLRHHRATQELHGEQDGEGDHGR